MKNKLEQYVNKIYKGLKLPFKLKKHIKLELLSEIQMRLEEGEALDNILLAMGTPDEVIKEFEASYEDEYFQFKKEKTFVMFFWAIVTIFLGGIGFCLITLIIQSQLAFSTVIGGGNGNTAVFLAYKWSKKEILLGIAINSMLFIVSLLQFIKYSQLLKKKNRV
ncbi:MAG: hypothetical protein HFG39_11290 [Lachnospiraceae bacterium]|nr:hypothetical protein [Lachnospiraceae bacterium]